MPNFDDSPLHTLWSKAQGTPDYDKDEWGALEKKLHAGLAALNRERRERDKLFKLLDTDP